MEQLFSQLYPFVLAIGLAGFGPQILKLLRDPASADSLSVSTWFMWTLSWGISLGYGITNLHDVMFIVAAAVFMVAHGIVLGFALYRRLITRFKIETMNALQPFSIRVHK